MGFHTFCVVQPNTDEALLDFFGDTPVCTDLETDDVVVAVDCSDIFRLADQVRQKCLSVFLNVDHHLANTRFATHNIVQSDASAACELLTDLFYTEKLTFDRVSAEALWMGILTDTGNFTYNNTSERTFLWARQLIRDYDLVPSHIASRVYQQNPFRRVQFLAFFLTRIQLELNGSVAAVTLTEQDYRAYGAQANDADGFVSQLLSIKGVQIAVFLETRQNLVKCSLRSRSPQFNVHRIAQEFNGGGHRCASGFRVDGSVEDVRRSLFQKLSALFA
jgi:phosphoesterase RecJ-like protein